MKTTKIFPVFIPKQKSGRTYDSKTPNFKEAYKQAGVYVIFKLYRSGRIEPVYVGKGLNAGQCCARHFYSYNDKYQNKSTIRKDETGAKYNQETGQYRTSFEDEKKITKFFVKFYLWGENPTDQEKEEISNKEENLINILQPKYNVNLKTGIKINPATAARLQDQAEEAADNLEEYKNNFDELEPAPF